MLKTSDEIRQMSNTAIEGLVSLHRYYIWANRMRTHFDEIISNGFNTQGAEIEANLYMSYWYGGLYVVIEGWQELSLADGTIDQLLSSPNVGLLKRYRNGVFHFQKKYSDERFMEFIRDGDNVVNWVRSLNLELGRYFLVKGKAKYSS